jgi:hypothetical protein
VEAACQVLVRSRHRSVDWREPPPNGSRLSCGRLAHRAQLLWSDSSRPPGRKHSASLRARSARQLQALVRRHSQKLLVSSSVTRKTGLPPVEIDTACATAFCAGADAAAACRASMEGK